jgi:hypothetical protein
MGWYWAHLVRWPLTGLLYQAQMIHDDCGAVGGMRIGRGNRSTRSKPTPVLLCPPQVPYNLTWARTRAAAVGNRRLTAWAMARPMFAAYFHVFHFFPRGWGQYVPWKQVGSYQTVWPHTPEDSTVHCSAVRTARLSWTLLIFQNLCRRLKIW